ncbi:phage head-tail joining protein [Limimaricola sp.]|uniref:phage head-tail joining protein n=1 Tax=Limimaricola sp. TaxID=2211665 RepID=UPI0040596D80
MAIAHDINGEYHVLRFENVGELRIARDKLRAARFEGLRTVRFGEDEVAYKSDNEMATALGAIEAEIAKLERGTRPRTFYPRASKGL